MRKSQYIWLSQPALPRFLLDHENFAAEDIPANRAGLLTPLQLMRLRAMRAAIGSTSY